MSSFKDKFQGRSHTVAKDGTPQQQPHQPQQHYQPQQQQYASQNSYHQQQPAYHQQQQQQQYQQPQQQQQQQHPSHVGSDRLPPIERGLPARGPPPGHHSGAYGQRPDGPQLNPMQTKQNAYYPQQNVDIDYGAIAQEVSSRGSRSSHPVLMGYTPHTLREYKKVMNDVAQMKRGGLGMNDNEEKAQERERRKMIQQYGDKVSALNACFMEVSGEDLHNRPVERKPTKEQQLAAAKRDRGRMFANAVAPHPRKRRERKQMHERKMRAESAPPPAEDGPESPPPEGEANEVRAKASTPTPQATKSKPSAMLNVGSPSPARKKGQSPVKSPWGKRDPWGPQDDGQHTRSVTSLDSTEIDSAMKELEEKHRRDQQAILELRKQLNMA